MKRSTPIFRRILASAFLLTMTPAGLGETRSMENADGSYNLTSWDTHGGEQIGASVALIEQLALLGAPTAGWHGAGDVLVCSQDAMERWGEVAWLSHFMDELPSGAQFGATVVAHPEAHMGSNLLAVGAPGISQVYLFQGVSSGQYWQLLGSIEGVPSSGFGTSIAMQDDIIAIGAPSEAGKGSVSIYTFDAMLNGGDAEFQGKATGSDYKGEDPGEFGHAVALGFGGVFVGSPGNSPTDGGGMVSAYALPSGGDPMDVPLWSVEHGGDAAARFGSALAMFGDRLAIGVPGPYASGPDSEERGRVEIYEYDADEESFVLQTTIETDLPSPQDRCGYALHMFEDMLSIGVPGANVAGDASGLGMVYQYSPSAGTWRQWATIVPGGGSSGDFFGTSTVISEIGVIFGSPTMGPFGSESGLGLLYETPSGIDGEWQRDTRASVPVIAERGLIRSPAQDRGGTSEFGRGLAAAGDYALIGDPDNRVIYAYSRTDAGAAWTEDHELPYPDADNIPDEFGMYIEMVDDLALVGSPRTGTGGEVYVYERNGTTWSLMQTMTPVLTTLGFGESLAIERADDGSTWCAVGDPSIGQNKLVSGSVHLYRRGITGTFAFMEVLLDTAYVPGADSQFGHALDFGPAPNEPLLLAVGDPVDEVYGAVSIFECDSGGAAMQQMLVGDSHYHLFGSNVVIDDEYCIVGSMPDESQGEVAVHTRNGGFRDDEHGGGGGGGGSNEYTFTWTLSYPSGRLYDHFGTDMVLSDSPRRLLISAPGLDYGGLNSGAVLSYIKGDDPPDEWALDAMMFTPQAVDGESLGELALTDETVLLGRSEFGTGGSQVFGRVYDFPLGNSVSWTNQQGGPIDGAWNWSTDPNQSGATTGLFSLLVGSRYDVQISWQWQGALEVMFDTIGLESTGTPAQVLGDLTISSAAVLKTAEVALDGWLQVDDDLIIGPQQPGFFDEAGKLSVASTGALEVLDRIELASSASLKINLDPAASTRSHDDPDGPGEPDAPVSGSVIELGGSLEVSFDEFVLDAGDLSAGDQFILMESVDGPFVSSLDLTLLPGIPGGELAFVVSIENGQRGGAGQSMIATVVDLAGLLDFGDPNSVAVSGEPTDVEIVDLTGDGAEEICVIFADSPGTLAIFENDGAGGIAQQIVVDTGDLPIDITSGDFDGDGHQDLAIANFLSSDVLILYNDDEDLSDGFEDDDADGSPGTDLDVVWAPTCLAGIDFDFDSNRDLIVGMDVGDGTGFLQIYLGATQRGEGRMPAGGSKSTPRPPKYIDPSEEEDQKAYSFTVAQEDGQTSSGGSVSAMRGGSGDIVLTDYTTGVDPGGMTTGDFNGDGLGDVAVTSITNGTVAILRQDAANPGEFLSAIFVSLGTEPSRIAAVDFDQDGNVDLAAITYDGNDDRVVRILQNDGNMAFTSVDTAVGENVALIDAGDVSGDGSSELVTISGAASLRGDDSVLLSLRELDSAVFCDGDVDASGEVDVLDLLEVLSNWDCAGSKCIGDANGDDVVDVLDLLMVIGNWGICG